MVVGRQRRPTLGGLPLATAIAAVPLASERPSAVFWMLSLAGAGSSPASRCARGTSP